MRRTLRAVGFVRSLATAAAILPASLVLGTLPGDAAAQQSSTAPPAPAQPGARPVPGPVELPRFFEQAVERQTRTTLGSPGEGYWTNWSRYEIEARLEPETGRLEGGATIQYENRSPHRLQTLVLHLHQNLHREGVVRNEDVEITGGVTLSNLQVDSATLEEGELQEGPSYRIDGTVMTVRPPEPVDPGDTVSIRVGWETVLPQDGAGRMGWSERELYFVAYWFPKMAVFDDLRGWDAEPYRGTAEFYDGFGDYEVSLSVPGGWTVMATGELQNPEEVLSEQTRSRLDQASTADDRVVVASTEDVDSGRVTLPTDGRLVYRFQADSVRDFAWTMSNAQRWDATSARVDDRDGDGQDDRVLIHSFWREDRAPLWSTQWRHGKQSIEFHSEYTGFTYPWSHMTSVEGADIIGGGMEFPMITVMGPYTDRPESDLFNVTSHEIAHMWIPMIVGTNEKRYAWMDEGTTSFLENQSRMELWPGVNHHRREAQGFLQVAAADAEEPLLRHGDFYPPGPSYGVASYSKPAALLVALREVVMDRSEFEEAYRTFHEEWAWGHPTPWDLFHTFERFHGAELDWFWTSFYEEAWMLDHAVTRLESRPDGTTVIHVEDRGRAPFPATLRIQTTSGGSLVRDVPVEHWLEGHTRAEIEIPASAGAVTRVELNTSGYAPDADRSNDFWPRG